MKVLVAMSGGVDSSVTAALLMREGHEVVGATLKLWGGSSDSGCCSVSDVDDARRVAHQLGIPHHVFNFTEDFSHAVVNPYVEEHKQGRTPNPCIECNRSVKFGTLLQRSLRLGFDALATGHHARVVSRGGATRLLRGVDVSKDQSYVLSMLTTSQLRRVVLPVGSMTKAQVRALARELRLRTANKPDSQEVCFIHSSSGRRGFLSERLELHPAVLVDAPGNRVVGSTDAVELVTAGQRRGLGLAGDGSRRYALRVDVAGRRVFVGGGDEARTADVKIGQPTWVECPLSVGERALAQTSAHAPARACTWEGDLVRFDEPQALVAPGQTIAFYDRCDPEVVIGSAKAA